MSSRYPPIIELINGVQTELKRIGLSNTSVSADKYSIYTPIRKFFEKNNCTEYNPQICDAYLQHIQLRFEAGEICRLYYVDLKLGMNRLIEYQETGKISWKADRAFKYNVKSPVFVEQMAVFKETLPKNKHAGTVLTDLRKFHCYIEKNAVTDYSGLTHSLLQSFLSEQAGKIKINSMRNLRHHLKKYLSFLFDNGMTDININEFLSLSSREKNLYPPADPETVSSIFKSIDTNTPIGKRDYAMFMLATALGLRSIDIVTMKLSDIDWQKGIINICQSKTGKPLALPLISSVGAALEDYILNARPKTERTEVFLRARAPFKPLSTAGMRYNFYINKVPNINRTAYDGKSFHSLRRAVGTSMVIKEVPILTMAQVLGHSNIDSTRPYISLDTIHLKQCSLSLDGIEPLGGIYVD